MKKITFLLLLLIFMMVTEAQKVYFIYLQSENQEQFYARIGEKIYNSSSSGYLILSKLVDSTYNVNIGLQESQSPEQLFSVTVNKKDKGYLIKNFDEKGWGLFDLQSFAVVMPVSINSASLVKTEKRESNAFTDLLAKAADDSTIKEKPVFVNEEPKKNTVDSASLKMTEVKKEEVAVEKKVETQLHAKDSLIVKAEEKKAEVPLLVSEKKDETQKPNADSAGIKLAEVKQVDLAEEKKANEIKLEEKTTVPVISQTENKSGKNPFVDEFQKSIVVKRSESSTTEGFGITFLDVTGDGSIDTVRILIPNEKEKPVIPDVKKDGLKFLDITSIDSANVQTTEGQKEKITEKNNYPETADKTTQRSNNCIQQATDDDFFSVRKNMAAGISNDNMINEAKKI
ncbi:MAG TPA: hypothetical protein VI548_13045, partial [Chitinophagaceae bacterium]|nr:hypothetical protein [Chitinophagaceae bacterium]